MHINICQSLIVAQLPWGEWLAEYNRSALRHDRLDIALLPPASVPTGNSPRFVQKAPHLRIPRLPFVELIRSSKITGTRWWFMPGLHGSVALLCTLRWGKYTDAFVIALCAEMYILLTCRWKVVDTYCTHRIIYWVEVTIFSASKTPFCRLGVSIHAHVLEPVRPAVFLEQESFAIGETARDTPFTLGRFRAVEVGYVLVSYITEPEIQSDGLSILDSRSMGSRTNGSCFYPQTAPTQYYAPAHPPTSHRRNHPLDPSARSTLHMLWNAKTPCPQSRNCSKNDTCCTRALVYCVPASSCYPRPILSHCSRASIPDVPP